MKKILLISEPKSPMSAWAYKALDVYNLYQIFRISGVQLLKSKLLQEQSFDCLVYVCDTLDTFEMKELQELSQIAPDASFVVLAAQIAFHSYGQIHQMKNMITLQSPTESRVLLTLIEKTSSRKRINFDVSPRFITDHPVRMVVLKTGLLIPTRMRNYSASGAFLEYRGISLKVGDLIQLNLGNEAEADKKKSFLVEAKVIWIRDGDNARSPARGVGVQFLQTAGGQP